MKIFIDLGHPAHVHYFKNTIWILEKQGHSFLITARNRSLIFYLLNHYGFKFFSRGKGSNGIIGKLLYMIYADFYLLYKALHFKPDIFLSFASPYAAHAAFLTRKPHIVLDDTEHAKFGQMFYRPFSKVFINPSSFYKDFGPRQIKVDSFTELLYLHPEYFNPDPHIKKKLGLREDEKFVLLRFVSWNANHDIGHSGLDEKTRNELISLFSKEYKVFISTEEAIDKTKYSKFRLPTSPEDIHSVLSQASILVSESGTMASEAALLGTPVIYVNSLPLMGYLIQLQKAKLLIHFNNPSGVVHQAKKWINEPGIKIQKSRYANELVASKSNFTDFLIKYISDNFNS